MACNNLVIINSEQEIKTAFKKPQQPGPDMHKKKYNSPGFSLMGILPGTGKCSPAIWEDIKIGFCLRDVSAWYGAAVQFKKDRMPLIGIRSFYFLIINL